jgi:hypothetical protein
MRFHCLKMTPAGDHRDVGATQGRAGGEMAANGAGAEDA